MSIRLTITGLLSMAMTIAMTSAAFAEEYEDKPEKLGRSSGSGFCLVERDLVSWGFLDGGTCREEAPQTGIPTNSSSLREDDMPPGEYEIITHSSEERVDGQYIYPDSSATDEVGILDPSIVFGLKYSFKTFQLDQFRKSFLSFLSNGNGTGTGREKAMGLYVEIP
jgi:hypothetical protein